MKSNFEIHKFDLQCTCSMILFDTGDGIPFDAMHKYGPISDRVIPCSSSSFPSTV